MKPTEEVVALWQKVFGEPPAITAAPALMARIMIEHLNAAPPYRPKAPKPSRTPRARR